MLAHGPSFGRNPRGSPDFLVYPVPKAYRQAALSWYLGSEVLACRTLSLESQSSASLRMQPPGSGSRLARSPAWRGLPQCPGYGHWVSYCVVAPSLPPFPTFPERTFPSVLVPRLLWLGFVGCTLGRGKGSGCGGLAKYVHLVL